MASLINGCESVFYILTFPMLTFMYRDEGGVDDPKQSACGIPHNAYWLSHVAIHPYWLKYAPLDRLCLFSLI